MQSLEIVVVGQFHQPAELQFYRVEGCSIQRLRADGGCRRGRPGGRAEAVRVTRNFLFMQEFSFRRLARAMTSARRIPRLA